jgi:GST-like protein
VLQWLMFQMGGVGPMLGQAHHFRIYAPEKIPYAIDRYTNEAKRLYGVMNRRLAKLQVHGRARLQHRRHRHLPVAALWKNQGIDWNDHPHLKGWFDEIAARPAVSAASRCWPTCASPITDDKAREVLFGKAGGTALAATKAPPNPCTRCP